MPLIDFIEREEVVLNKVILYSLKHRKLKMLDRKDKICHNTKKIPINSPVFPTILSAPLKVYFSITKKCNLNCPMCFSYPRNSTQQELSLENINKLILQLADIGVFEIRFTGGEPTIHPHFFDIVNLVDQLNMNSAINTNGIYSTKTLDKLINGPICDFRISLDGTKNIHEIMRGKMTFDKTIGAIKELTAAGKDVHINTTLSEQNKDLLEEMVDIAENLGVSIKFILMRNIGKAKETEFGENNIISPNDWEKIKYKLCLLADKSKISIAHCSNQENTDYRSCIGKEAFIDNAKCSALLTQIGIDPEGNVYSGGCIDAISKRLSIGSVLTHPIIKLWHFSNLYVKENILSKYANCEQCTFASLWDSWKEQLSIDFVRSVHIF